MWLYAGNVACYGRERCDWLAGIWRDSVIGCRVTECLRIQEGAHLWWGRIQWGAGAQHSVSHLGTYPLFRAHSRGQTRLSPTSAPHQ